MKSKGIHNGFHVRLLKPFKDDTFGRYEKPLPPVFVENGEEHYEIDAILDTKKKRGNQMHLVQWKGYPDSDNS